VAPIILVCTWTSRDPTALRKLLVHTRLILLEAFGLRIRHRQSATTLYKVVTSDRTTGMTPERPPLENFASRVRQLLEELQPLIFSRMRLIQAQY